MKDGVCPKCQGTNIFNKKVGNGYFFFPVTILTNVHPLVYVCTDCGFTEFYTEQKYWSKIRQHWSQVFKGKRKRN